jgi:hypothetical protein
MSARAQTLFGEREYSFKNPLGNDDDRVTSADYRSRRRSDLTEIAPKFVRYRTDVAGSAGRTFGLVKALPPMDRTVAQLNIAHYRRKLATEQDETKRQMLLRLLAEEEAKLAALNQPPEGKRCGD